MYHKIVLFVILFIIWVIFSGFLEPFFLISGVISCIIAVYFTSKMGTINANIYIGYLKPKAIIYFFWLCKEIFLSSVTVARKVWQEKPNISPALGWISFTQKTDLGIATYANSITLTPGTVCTKINNGKLEVHALCEEGISELKNGKMDRKITGVIG